MFHSWHMCCKTVLFAFKMAKKEEENASQLRNECEISSRCISHLRFFSREELSRPKIGNLARDRFSDLEGEEISHNWWDAEWIRILRTYRFPGLQKLNSVCISYARAYLDTKMEKGIRYRAWDVSVRTFKADLSFLWFLQQAVATSGISVSFFSVSQNRESGPGQEFGTLGPLDMKPDGWKW